MWNLNSFLFTAALVESAKSTKVNGNLHCYFVGCNSVYSDCCFTALW